MTDSQDIHMINEYYREDDRGSFTRKIIALIFIGFFVQVPYFLSGNIMFYFGDPVLYIISTVLLYASILVVIGVIKIFWDRRKSRMGEDNDSPTSSQRF